MNTIRRAIDSLDTRSSESIAPLHLVQSHSHEKTTAAEERGGMNSKTRRQAFSWWWDVNTGTKKYMTAKVRERAHAL